MGQEDPNYRDPLSFPAKRLMVDIADRDAELREAAESRQRYYVRTEVEARQKAEAAAKNASRVLEWSEQGDEIKRLNSRVLGVIGGVLSGPASTEQFEAAMGLLSKCSAIAKAWSAEQRQGGAGEVETLAALAADESVSPEDRARARARLAEMAKR